MEFENLLRPIFIDGLQKILSWYKSDDRCYLQSIFDQVGFKDKDRNGKKYYNVPASLSLDIAYPICGNEGALEEEKRKTLLEIDEHFQGFSARFLEGLSANQLLFLLEKFGCNVPMDDVGLVSVFDSFKIKGAKQIIESNRKNLGHEDNLLMCVDISGIQRFIYTITSSGALKNLRARSFFVEILSNHIIYRILSAFNLHHVNVLLNGGGTVYILSACPNNYRSLLDEINYKLNKWLLKKFDGILYATFAQVRCLDAEMENSIENVLDKVSRQLFVEKNRKFSALLDKGDLPFSQSKDPEFAGCEVCRRDDPETEYIRLVDGEETFRCALCNTLVEIGNRVPKVKFIYQCDRDVEKCLQIENSFYLLTEDKTNQRCLWVVYRDDKDFINDISESSAPILARTYTKRNRDLPHKIREKIETKIRTLRTQLTQAQDKTEAEDIKEEINSLNGDNIATLEYIAESAEGAKFIAGLRMDADNVGKILNDGFYGRSSLEKLSSFSRSLNYFFRLYLSSLCGDSNNASSLGAGTNGRNVHVIYSGGDDLFILGSWSDINELAIAVGEAFKRYTCNNIDVGISAGLTIHDPKYPVNQIAEETRNALAYAKANYQPCWMCRREWQTCPLYDSGDCLRKDSLAPFFSEHMLARKRELDREYRSPKYSRRSARLKLALRWEMYDPETKQIRDEVSDYVTKPLRAFRIGGNQLGGGFFHRIKALLDIWYDKGVLYLPQIVWILGKFKKELQQNVDRQSHDSLYDLYETYMHCIGSEYDERFSALHIPLTWIILQTRGGQVDDKA